MNKASKMPFAVLSTTLAVSLLMSGAPISTAQAETDAGHNHELEYAQVVAMHEQMDSDADGLNDLFEQGVTHAEKADTDGNGVNDGDEDSDGDGLTNLVEQTNKTNPLSADTDGDRLSDADELQRYGTSPVKSDTDADGLNDGTEILNYNLDALQADQDGDGQLDGSVVRAFAIPSNEQGITGTMSGIGNIPEKLTVRETPILIVQQMNAVKSFDLESLDATAKFNVTIQLAANESQKLKDPVLFRYDADGGTLVEVEKQIFDKKTGSISAEFVGGGSFVVLSKDEYKKAEKPQKTSYKGKHKSFKGKAKLVGMPNIEVDAAQVSADGMFNIERDGLKATYKITEMQQSAADGSTFVSVQAVTAQSGKMPTILVHGLYGSSTTWGFNQKWSNGGDTPSAESAIASSETFTGKTYASGTASTYSNIDVQYITSTSDSAEMGPILVGKGYTRNVDLFTFEYHSDGHVGTAAGHLKNYIANLKAAGKIASTSDVNLVAHSKGGLVSRYYIENLSGSTYVARLTTLGTPHYGSDLSTFGDMDRDDSDLWLSNNHDAYCNTFTNSHPYTKYFGFGGFKVSAGDLNATSPSLRGVWSVGKLAGDYDADVRTRFSNAGNGISWFSYADIGDTAVNIDTAMGSDKDPDYSGTFPTLTFQKRWYIFHETYGDHSGMRKYSTVNNLVYGIQQGSYDL